MFYSDIIQGLCDELSSLFADTGTEVLRDTQYKLKDMPVNTLSLIIIGIGYSPDNSVNPGGAIKYDVEIIIESYFYDINSSLESDDGNSTQAYSLIDTIMQYMAKMNWQTESMKSAVANYSWKLTLNGTVKSTEMQVQGGGVIPGYAINYLSCAIDTSTTSTKDETFAHERIAGITTLNSNIDYEWLENDITTILTNSDYNAMSTGTVGQYYFISDLLVIKKILTLNPLSHTPAKSETIIPNAETLFYNDNDNNVYLFDGDTVEIAEDEMVINS